MAQKGITTVADLDGFFEAYNQRDWDTIFEKYMAEDCVWHATESALRGRQELLDYWTKSHGAISETLGKPEKAVIGDDTVYLQVDIELHFIADGSFLGKPYRKGDVAHLRCADFYELNDERKIKSGTVYSRLSN